MSRNMGSATSDPATRTMAAIWIATPPWSLGVTSLFRRRVGEAEHSTLGVQPKVVRDRHAGWVVCGPDVAGVGYPESLRRVATQAERVGTRDKPVRLQRGLIKDMALPATFRIPEMGMGIGRGARELLSARGGHGEKRKGQGQREEEAAACPSRQLLADLPPRHLISGSPSTPFSA